MWDARVGKSLKLFWDEVNVFDTPHVTTEDVLYTIISCLS